KSRRPSSAPGWIHASPLNPLPSHRRLVSLPTSLQPPLADRIPGGVPSPWFEEERLGDLGLPFASEKDGADKRLYCLSNPSFFTVNEVAVGVTTNDILCHLSGDEVSYNPGNRLARLAAHLLQQQSFFPLFPPPADGQAQLDLRHADHWRMPITPDVLLLPSKLTPFVKDVGGALCINPGTLTKGGGGGTYAMLHIHPLPAERLERMSPETEFFLLNSSHAGTA
ncbi:DNA polymerase alpha subunit B, partial [Nannochloropsis gaditana CCMP526]|uniref:DNA polymerase alpha subunit B n=1 Tax=Nannochloropsis gaditana (strain CCMP526) TaxID=1093141 RepID=UPI00029F76CE